MILLDRLILSSKKYFPKLKINYKNESILMKIIGFILFFNKDFLSEYTTTLGNFIYFPNKEIIRKRPISMSIVFLHELVHVYDFNKLNIIFSILYLTPQIFFIFFIPFTIIFGKIGLLFLLFLLPIPSFFRMYFEKRAYLSSLYVIYKISNKLKFNPNLNENKETMIFSLSSYPYYYAWFYKFLNKDFDKSISKILNNERPFEDPVFDMLDKLILEILK